MTSAEKVSAYIKKHTKWSNHLAKMRALLLATELQEDVKWGAPTYTLKGKNVIGMAAFKNHMGIWFHQGVFLKDTHQQLVNAQEGKTKALRQWRFEEGDELNENWIADYIKEAIKNAEAGKEIKPKKASKKVEIPVFLTEAFAADHNFKKAFNTLTPGKQREYAEYIETAKRDATKQSRLEKIKPLVLEGKGLNDKYKNC